MTRATARWIDPVSPVAVVAMGVTATMIVAGIGTGATTAGPAVSSCCYR
jgi:hypothetical protein